jgi:hypothetical protein
MMPLHPMPHSTPDPDSATTPPAIVATMPDGDAPPALPTRPPVRAGAPVAALPIPRRIAPNIIGIGALVGLVGAPAVASATDLAEIPAELGTWGLVLYGLVRVVQELLVWRRENAQDTAAREEAARLRSEVVALRDELRRIEEREDAAREQALQDALAEVRRLRG